MEKGRGRYLGKSITTKNGLGVFIYNVYVKIEFYTRNISDDIKINNNGGSGG